MSKAMRFLLYVDDIERAVEFYTEALGWQMRKAPPELGGDKHYWITAGPDDEPGLDGDLEVRVGNRATINHYRIPSYKDTLEKIKNGGGKVVSEEDMGEMGKHAFCEDPDGNLFGVMWENPNWTPPKPPAQA